MLLLFHHWRINACTGLDWMDDEYFFQMLIWENFTHVYGANICIVKFNGSSFSSRFEFNQLLVVRKFQKCSSLALRHKALSLFPFFAWLSIHPSIHIYTSTVREGKNFLTSIFSLTQNSFLSLLQCDMSVWACVQNFIITIHKYEIMLKEKFVYV